MNNTVVIRILDKEYQVNCPPEEQSALISSAQELDKRMRDIRKAGNVIGLERIAVMAALNLTYDLLRAENRAQGSESLNEDLSRIDAQLDEALARFQQPEL
ncbi:MAG: cell division protein ZapA [Porticoccaceae bacterium]|nr:cell division protein ZapA [Porticoccaceae bacterium]